VRDSFLLHKPVGVLGNQGACIIAKSYEMKATGVKTGEPIWEARVKCPQGIFLKRDFRWYEVLSRQMLDTVGHFSPQVECFFQTEALPGGIDTHLTKPVDLAVLQALLAEMSVPTHN
jgi:hypothetical protein